MPRSKAMMKKRAGAGSSGGPKKIVIKPFSKPPTLPSDYYEKTSQELLKGTQTIIFAPRAPSPSPHNTSSSQPPSTLKAPQTISLQTAYQQVVNLVSHQYGPRLYRDLVAHFQQACEDYVLPDPASSSSNQALEPARVLGYLQTQYQTYVDYLLLCKHVFLPLDRTHAWTSDGTVVKRLTTAAAAAAAAATTSSSSSSSLSTSAAVSEPPASSSNNNNNNGAQPQMQTQILGLWQVGLEQFRLRLQAFQLDGLLYETWWKSLQLDWEDSLALDQQALLPQTVYMWQDLNVLQATLQTKLEPDLKRFFTSKSQDLMHATNTHDAVTGGGGGGSCSSSSGSYNATSAIHYCHSKWMHVAYHWSRFLPKSTTVQLLETQLIQPHLTTEWWLAPSNFDALVEAAASDKTTTTTTPIMPSTPGGMGGQHATTTTTTTTTPTSLQQLWMLAGRLPGGSKAVATAISQYAKTRGLALMQFKSGDTKTGKQKIAELLQLQEQLVDLLGHLPHASDHVSLKYVWEDVVNPSSSSSLSYGGNDSADTNVVAEALAKYVDAYLRDAKKQVDATSSNQWANQIISGIFCYLQAKDIFEAFFKRDLAKRLLWNRIVSMDVERHFVSLLKAECGAGYTAKMEGMFQDMDWSRETMNRYKQSAYGTNVVAAATATVGDVSSTLTTTPPTTTTTTTTTTGGFDQLDMDIQVLTTGYWPVYPQFPKLILPQELLAPQDRFANYYKTKYQGRRMTWQYALGHVVVRFKPSGQGPKYDLIVSLCQALVLLQFNRDDDGDGNSSQWKLPQLMAAVGVEDRDEMERILQSLCMGKDGTRVLQRRDHDATPEKKKKLRMTVHNDDTFRVHSGFKSNSRRIRITNILMKETKEDRDKTVEAVSLDRLYLIDAVLVRIMKARKTLLHQHLIPQVLEQVKVPAQPADVKKRIESLIEREYMERDSKDRNRYNYLA